MRAPTQWRLDRPLVPMVCIGVALVAGPWVAWLISEDLSLPQPSWRPLALLCIAGAAPLALRWPVTLVFGAYAFVLPFEQLLAPGGGVSGMKVIGIVAAGAFVVVGLMEKRFVKPPAPALWFTALVLWGVMTLAWSVAPAEILYRLPTIFSLLALYLAAVCFRVSEREVRIVCLVAMLGGVLAATAGVISGFDTDAPENTRGTLSVDDQSVNPNAVGQSLLLPISVAITLFLSARSVAGRAVTLAVVAALGAGIFLTMSRASLLALITMLCVLLVRSRVRWPLVVVVGVLAGLLPFMPAFFFERIGWLISGEERTGAGRTGIWEVGLALLPRFGWFGSGFGTWGTAWTIGGGKEPQRAPHNIFLWVAVELGVVGLALLLMLIFTHLRIAWRTRSSTSDGGFPVAIEAVCYATLVAACFSDDLWTKMFWTPFTLAIWACRNSRLGTPKSRSSVAELADERADNADPYVGHVTRRH